MCTQLGLQLWHCISTASGLVQNMLPTSRILDRTESPKVRLAPASLHISSRQVKQAFCPDLAGVQDFPGGGM